MSGAPSVVRESLIFTPEATAATAGLLLEVATTLRAYVVLTEPQLVTAALWCLHTWVIDAADSTLYLRIHSPLPESGKTRLLETLHALVRDPWLTGRTTAAAITRKVAAGATLLYDETDRAFASGEEYAATLLAVLNSGWRRGGAATVCVGQGTKMEAIDFPVFGPKAFAGLDRLPDTVVSRSAPIAMRRRVRDEVVERFYWREVKARTAALRDRLGAWVAWAAPALTQHQPDIPEALGDRQGESWTPLLAIGDMAGGNWPERARRAALALHRRDVEDDSLGVQLLSHVRGVFDTRGTDRITTEELLALLKADTEAAWGELGLTSRRLSTLLRPFGIRPEVIRVGTATPRGYLREDFEDAFARYLPSDPQHPQQANTGAGFGAFSHPQQPPLVADSKNDETALQSQSVAHVADSVPSRGEDGEEVAVE